MRQPFEGRFLKYLDSLNEHKFDFSLARIKKTLILLGNPHHDFRVIHITGSNGKGSVAAYFTNILIEHGISTGTYTSPHLKHPSERIAVNGLPVDRLYMARQGLKLASLIAKQRVWLTYFEFLTALAFLIFSKAGVELAIVEVGLGGRYDATNVDYRHKFLSVITSISMEHTNYLGKTLKSILKEKEKIIGKEPAVCNINSRNLRNFIKLKHHNKVFFADEICRISDVRVSPDGLIVLAGLPGRNLLIKTPMPELVQAENIRTTLAGVEVLKRAGLRLEDPGVIKGIMRTMVPGRLTWDDRGYYTSVAHNPAAVSTMLESVYMLHPGKKVTFMFSILKDKDVKAVLSVIKKYKRVRLVLTQIKNERAISLEKLEQLVVKCGIRYIAEKDNYKALKAARRVRGKGVIVIGGSFYLVNKFI
jgi:dihydrofolate synthase/folylpolyglutamate synthase